MPRVVLLAGPSGSGNPPGPSQRAARDHAGRLLPRWRRPGSPRHPELGIVDWDHPDAWDAARAIDTLVAICADGTANIPVYEIAHDRAVRTERFFLGKSPVFVAEGLFAGDITPACRERGILADAVVVWRKPWKNFVRRLLRDLVERRKPPLTLLRRGLA